jgi:hypothetical protein
MSSTAITAIKPEMNLGRIEQVLIKGDLSSLTEIERVTYYKAVCQTVGLNPLTQPFDYIMLNGKLVLYAKKAATDQLRDVKKVSIQITKREAIEGVYIVTAHAKLPDGREDESTGAVTITGLKGDHLANAFMKAETKAKRRVTLSICGLGMLDETEVESIPETKKNQILPQQPEPGDGIEPEDQGYMIPAGKYAKKSLEEVGPKALSSYVSWMDSEEAKGKQFAAWQLDLRERAIKYIADLENANGDSGL